MKTKTIKSTVLATFAFFALTISAYAGGENPIKVKKSKVTWVGKKVTGQHTGTIAFKKGSVALKKGNVVGGKFVVDMTTINVTDLDGNGKNKLEGHLNSDDFFGVKKHPEAIFVITSVKDNVVKGDLTIKGHTEKESFTLKIKDNVISGVVLVDRTKYGIRFGSNSFFDNLKNKAIDDNFELTIHIEF